MSVRTRTVKRLADSQRSPPGLVAALSFGAVATTGPLAGNGWLTFALYPVSAPWLASMSVYLRRRPTSSIGVT